MKKLLIVLLSSSLVLISTISAQSKEPKYKGLFNLATDARYYKFGIFSLSSG
jgi:hypothetical protein